MFDDKSLPVVESELVEMAGHLAAGTCRFLLLLAEFDRREGWAGPGLRSCAHWLNWRVGLSLRTARDQLRVAQSLGALPATTAAFAAGRVSYSKVRALTRIATSATEEGLLNVALHGTTSQLESLVQAARAGGDPVPAAARRGLRWTSASDGSMLVTLRIPAERGHELLRAIEVHLAEQEPDTDPDGSAEPLRAEPVLDDLDDLAARAELHRRTADERDEVRRRAEDHCRGSVSDPLAARRLDALLDLVGGAGPKRSTTLVVHLRADDHDGTEGNERPPAWIEDGPVIAPVVAGRLGCTAAVQALLVDRRGNPLHLGRSRRIASARQLRALRVRDGDRCVAPGCTGTRGLEAHHLRWWSLGGPTDLDNLALICPFHHTLVHDRGYGLSLGSGGFVFTRPDGTHVPATGPPPIGSADDLVARHATAIDDRTITPRWGGERLDRDQLLTWLLPELRAEAAA